MVLPFVYRSIKAHIIALEKMKKSKKQGKILIRARSIVANILTRANEARLEYAALCLLHKHLDVMQRHSFRRSAVKGSIIYSEEPTIPGPETKPGPFDPTGKISAQKEVSSDGNDSHARDVKRNKGQRGRG